MELQRKGGKWVMISTQQVINLTNKKLTGLINMSNEGQQKALLANLRRGIGHSPGELPELWGALFDRVPDEFLENQRSEWALYTALTLFALHQQGRDPKTEPMHREKIGLGQAIAGLVDSQRENEERITRRFNQIATSADLVEMSQHLRGTVQLLRGEGIAMDYARLAGDLYLYQNLNFQTDVRLHWGQDYYRTLNHTKEQEGEEESYEE
jgi:CRISPR system Cascade subunit CasB